MQTDIIAELDGYKCILLLFSTMGTFESTVTVFNAILVERINYEHKNTVDVFSTKIDRNNSASI